MGYWTAAFGAALAPVVLSLASPAIASSDATK